MLRYKNTQIGIFLSATLIAGIVLTFIMGQFEWVKYALEMNALGFTCLLLSILLLLFYKLTITIENGKIVAKFGIGLIKKTAIISEIDTSTIEEIKVPWYTGIGIRFTKKGILYNVKFGNAIYFKAAGKTFYVGTEDYAELKKAILASKV